MTDVTAATIRREFLEPVLDARAHNVLQERLIANKTPEVDSVADLLGVLTADTRGEREILRKLYATAGMLRGSNRQEGASEQSIAAAADVLATDLRGIELNGVTTALTAKSIARQLREPLRMLALSPVAAGAFVEAGRTIERVVARAPLAQLLSPAVEHELGAEKFQVLRELLAQRVPENSDAALVKESRVNDHQEAVPGDQLTA